MVEDVARDGLKPLPSNSTFSAEEVARLREWTSFNTRIMHAELRFFKESLHKLESGYETWKERSVSGGADKVERTPRRSENFERALAAVGEQYKEFEHALHTFERQGDFLALDRSPDWPRDTFLERDVAQLFRKAYAVRQRLAAAAVADMQQAPSPNSARGGPALSPGQIAFPDLEAYYSRYGLAPQAVERQLSQTLGIPGLLDGHATLLVNSGVAAVGAALTHALRVSASGSILSLRQAFFETRKVLEEEFGPKEGDVQARITKFGTTDEALAAIEHACPSVVFLEPVASRPPMERLDVPRIIATIAEKKPPDATCHVVIDYSILGPLADFSDIAQDLPPGLVLLLASSAQKVYQYGNDAAAAGMVTVVTSDVATEEKTLTALRRLRGRGRMPAPHEVALLRGLDPALIREQALLISRNTHDLAAFLESELKRHVTPSGQQVCSVSTAPLGAACGVPFFFLVFDSPALAERFTASCETYIERDEADVDVGASWGFRNTRYQRSDALVRIMPGAESPQQLLKVQSAFGRALSAVLRNLL